MVWLQSIMTSISRLLVWMGLLGMGGMDVVAQIVDVPCPPFSVATEKYYYKGSQRYQQCLCPPGQYATVTESFLYFASYYTSARECSKCPPGTYTSINNTLTTCEECKPPHWLSDYRDQCFCGAGFYSSSRNGYEAPCIPCQAGKYKSEASSIWSYTQACNPCPTGQFNPFTGQSRCKNCPAGVQADSSATTCLSQPGQWFDGTWVLPCDPGFKCIGDGKRVPCSGSGAWSPAESTVCNFCGAGHYLTSGSQDRRCEICLPGTYCKNLEQNLCNWGRFQPMAGSTTCLQCAGSEWAGYKESGHEICDDCEQGYVVAVWDSTGWFGCDWSASDCPKLNIGCRECKAGHYCPDVHTELPCHDGLYQPKTGQLECESCAVQSNWYTPPDNMPHEQCLECAPGYYITGSDSNECVECSAGMACDGTQERKVCFAGTYSPSSGASACTRCEPGHVSPNFESQPQGQTVCSACPAGKVTDDSQTVCVDCISKMSCPDGISMRPCNNGTYSTTPSQPCTLCAAGKYTPAFPEQGVMYSMQTAAEYGFQACLGCLPGYYSRTGASECQKCPVGYNCYGGILS